MPAFAPVWALPKDPLRCDKRALRVIRLAELPPASLPRGRVARADADAIAQWAACILDAGKKGLRTEPADASTGALWSLYRRFARSIGRRRR